MTAPGTNLRTDLTELAEKWDASVLGTAYARELRVLFAAHPAPETDEDLRTTCGRVLAKGGRGDRCATCAPVSDTRREDVAEKIAETH